MRVKDEERGVVRDSEVRVVLEASKSEIVRAKKRREDKRASERRELRRSVVLCPSSAKGAERSVHEQTAARSGRGG